MPQPKQKQEKPARKQDEGSERNEFPADNEPTHAHKSKTWAWPAAFTGDRFLLPILILIGFSVRFYKLHYPNAVVFDEFHFGKFVNYYNTGFYFFDIHPPLGKLTMYWVGKIFNYNYETCKYDNIHDVFAEDCNYMILRVTSAIFGVLILPAIYMTARELGARPWGAFLAGNFIALDCLHMIESRLILTDSQLLFYCALAFYVGVRYFKRWNEHCAAEEIRMGSEPGCGTESASEISEDIDEREDDMLEPCKPGSWKQLLFGVLATERIGGSASFYRNTGSWEDYRGHPPRHLSFPDRLKWAVVVGVTCGLAISVKWTGLATPGMVAIECLIGVFFLAKPVPFFDMIVMGVWAFIPYAFWYWMHFFLLPFSGDGDDFMLPEFKKTLIGNPIYDPNAPKVGFLTALWQLNRETLAANARIDVRHNWESKWHSWPITQRGILYWSSAMPNGRNAMVYLLANPLIVWMVLILLIMFVSCAAIYIRYRNPSSGITFSSGTRRFFAAGTYSLITYTLNLLPYILVSRSAFLYHYLPGLYYAQLLTALFVDRLSGKYVGGVVRCLLIVIVFGFYHFSPWVYANSMKPEEHDDRRWLPSWN